MVTTSTAGSPRRSTSYTSGMARGRVSASATHTASPISPAVTARVRPADYQKVVRTLLDNATKYARPGSVVRVRLVRDARRSRLEVSNHGDVISPEELEHLFDRFYRTDRARQRTSEGGFGLGLAIAKALIESVGGSISATSTERDGTTFTVSL